MNDTLFYNAHLVDESLDCQGAVLISAGRIRTVVIGNIITREQASAYCTSSGTMLIDAGGKLLMPAFIDMHVHFRYPGQTEKEDLDTGLHAAAAGGFGTVVAMPNTNPVVSSADQVFSVVHQAESYGLSRLIQTASITNGFSGTDISHLDGLDAERIPVISEDGHDVANAAVLFEAMKKAAEKGFIVSCHCEDSALAAAAKPFREKALALMREYGIPAWGRQPSGISVPISVEQGISDSLIEANRLLELAENLATERNLAIAKTAGCHIHIAHVSTEASIDAVRKAKNDRPEKVSCEVTPHHLALSGTEPPLIRALVNPPLRSDRDRAALVHALQDGTADAVATDHAPHTSADKSYGAPGFTGLETAYSVCNTVLVRSGCLSARELSAHMSAIPARLLHLNKGRLLSGYDADIVLADQNGKRIVDSRTFASKGKATPFDGQVLYGLVETTTAGGREIFKDTRMQ